MRFGRNRRGRRSRLVRRLRRGLGLRRRYGPRRRRSPPLGTIIATAVVLAGIGTATLLQRHRDHAATVALAEYVRDRGVPPAELARRAGWRHRAIFIADVPTAVAPKRIAAETLEALADGPGLDAVVLSVPSDRQAVIDRYLRADTEDPGALFADPILVHGRSGAARAYLEIYRTVWRLNRARPPSRRIRVLAVDPPNWPPDADLPPRVIAQRYARRDAHMLERLERAIFDRMPRARTLIFMEGYHGLKRGHGELRYGGGPPVRIRWLAARLEAERLTSVFTVLTDAFIRPSAVGSAVPYGATRVGAVLRPRLDGLTTPLAVPIDDHFDFLGSALRDADGPGLDLELRPEGYRLRDLADAYVFPGSTGEVRGVR